MTTLTCSDIQQDLSAYHDGELSSDPQVAVARHLSECGTCASVLEGYEELSGLVDTLDAPRIPRANWEQLERALDAGERVEAAHRAHTSQGAMLWRMGLIAAMIFVAIGIGWVAFRPAGYPRGDQQLAVDFSSYIDRFQSDPHEALQQLVAKYDGQAVDAKSAARHLGYRPVMADRLPDGYTVEAMYVLRMPCCTCVQTVCRDPHGNVLAIFEHDDEQSAWFGDRPAVRCQCSGKDCTTRQLGDRLAASWKIGTRYVTVLGARDMDQVRDLVTQLESLGG
ncbi:MAG: anti-sigma factor [Pirellulales bacterium]